MTDKFSQFSEGLSSPPSRMLEVTPDDNADLPVASRCCNVTTSGTLRITTVHGDTATLFVAAGIAFPIRARRIWATGTDATGIVALY
ncbi:spike base protein, RCAP_Rcc01079 family [Poseidonocella sedimentorum]|uniref:Uncharacterized protein n=1 Tax=Poseidonocella sedimentorum TaxID=871652 RepID=A0A1I6EP75_9RHOB|nr:hypothetical protein [Poseidonocella sedimentorum]SFR19308.1 hypothetical protein SAMN04515673_11627 [Poseidonocella sedimentorum]